MTSNEFKLKETTMGALRTFRLLALLLVTTATGAPVYRLALPAFDRVIGRPAPATLEPWVAAACAAALAVCWLWLVVGVWVTVLEALRRRAPLPARLSARLCPRLVRSVVLLALGLGVSAPAHGDAGAGPGLAGLRVPDRVVAVATDGEPVHQVRVRPGDTLWALAVGILAPAASDAAVDRAWRALAALNADRLGPDPDLIFPGTLLRVPAPGRLLGKDAR
jgi:hypothetical protein